jgi:hypothetical protein
MDAAHELSAVNAFVEPTSAGSNYARIEQTAKHFRKVAPDSEKISLAPS